jgi:hypothetical protein
MGHTYTGTSTGASGNTYVFSREYPIDLMPTRVESAYWWYHTGTDTGTTHTDWYRRQKNVDMNSNNYDIIESPKML